MDLKKYLQPVGRNDMEFIKEEQRDTDTGIRTSNIHLSFERRKRRDRNNIGLNFG